MPDATIVFKQINLGQQVRNVTVWSNVPTDPVEAQAFADELRSRWAGAVADRHTNQWRLSGITFVYNEAAPVYSVDYAFTAGPLVGTIAGPPTISQAALLVSTQFQGPPPNRGRIYFAGVGESQTDENGRWAIATLNDFENMVQDWANGIDYGSQICFLRIARRTPAGILTLTSPVTQVIGRSNPAVQRSRRLTEGI